MPDKYFTLELSEYQLSILKQINTRLYQDFYRSTLPGKHPPDEKREFAKKLECILNNVIETPN